MLDIALFGTWAGVMALLIWGYLTISRKHRREMSETLHRIAIPLPVATVTFRFPGSAGCSHFTIGGALTYAACGICGPLPEAPHG